MLINKMQLRFEVIPDEEPFNPRECNDNITKMVCFHNKYELGDKHRYRQKNYSSWEELKQAIIKEENAILIEPLYLYDHSGITISTKPFYCPWDSGQIGFIYITQGESEGLDDKKLKNLLNREVEEYDLYLRRDFWAYRIYGVDVETLDTNPITYCGGFNTEEEAREAGIAEFNIVKEKNIDKVGCAIRSIEINSGLAPEDSINFNPNDSEENDPKNW